MNHINAITDTTPAPAFRPMPVLSRAETVATRLARSKVSRDIVARSHAYKSHFYNDLKAATELGLTITRQP